jgi:DNA mismatch repair protein MSH2
MLYTAEDMDTGSKTVEEFLLAYAKSLNDDVSMRDADGNDDADAEEQIAKLRACYEQFKPRIENNPWCKTVLAEL